MGNSDPSMSKKCKVYIVYETGKEPELEIRMNSKHNHKDDIFRRYYGPYHMIIKRIKLPSKSVTKKNSENENEYKDNEIKIQRIQILPHFGIKLTQDNKLNQEYWKLYKRVYTRNWTHITSYDEPFIVDVYQRQGLGTRYLYYNIYDGWILWFK